MKKILSILIIFSFLIISTQSFAEKTSPLSWYKAVTMLNANNRTLGDMEKSGLQAWKDYNDAVNKAKVIDIHGTKVKIMGVDTYISYNQYVTMLMTEQKELLPEQMKVAWESARDGRVVTRNSLDITLRGLFIGLYGSDCDYELKLKMLELAGNINKQDNIKFKKGMISSLDLEESGYNLLKAQKEADASKRGLENITRSFNSFIGVDIKTAQDEMLFDEKYDATRLKSLDYYLQKALSGRLEIVNAEKQLALSEKKKEIIEVDRTNLNYTDVRKDYDSLVDSIASQKLKLERTRLDVEQGMKNAYVDVVKAGNSLKSLSKTLELQNRNSESIKLRYKQGYISKNILDQAEISLDQMKMGYNTSLFDYNTKLMKLENSAGIGPAYQEGGI